MNKPPEEPILKLIEGADVCAPEPLGRMDVLVAGDRVALVRPSLAGLGLPELEVIDGRGRILVPGFIDGHVHILGGGGEGGYATRTPEVVLSDLVLGGVTTVVGCLGTDGSTRSMANLVAKARGLEEEGVTTYLYTGSYQVPVLTLTGSIQDDLVLIDKVLGAGEIALSDHRSSQPTFEEFARIAASARVGGMLAGKAGVVNVHMGDGPGMLSLIQRVIDETEIPAKHFIPTHMNRNEALFKAGIAYARADGGRGRCIDLTSSSVPEDPGRACGAALRRLLEAGVSIHSISFSSDGQGSLPVFSATGEYQGLGVGRVETLFGEVKAAVQSHGVPLHEAVRVITTTPANCLKLQDKGVIRPGAQADLVLLERDLAIHTVLAKGRTLLREGQLAVLGTFERHAMAAMASKRRFMPRLQD